MDPTSSGDIAFPLRLSFQVALIATVFVALIGIPVAYLLATRNFRGKAVVEVVLVLPMVLPPVVTGYYLLLLLGRRGVVGWLSQTLTGHAIGFLFTWQSAVVASFAISFPLGVTAMRSAISAVDRAHAETSFTLGRSEFETVLYVVLPLALRGIFAGLALSFARALGEFGATIMVAGNIPGKTNTMALEIYNTVLYGEVKTAAIYVAIFTSISAVCLLFANWIGKRVVAS